MQGFFIGSSCKQATRPSAKAFETRPFLTPNRSNNSSNSKQNSGLLTLFLRKLRVFKGLRKFTFFTYFGLFARIFLDKYLHICYTSSSKRPLLARARDKGGSDKVIRDARLGDEDMKNSERCQSEGCKEKATKEIRVSMSVWAEGSMITLVDIMKRKRVCDRHALHCVNTADLWAKN